MKQIELRLGDIVEPTRERRRISGRIVRLYPETALVQFEPKAGSSDPSSSRSHYVLSCLRIVRRTLRVGDEIRRPDHHGPRETEEVLGIGPEEITIQSGSFDIEELRRWEHADGAPIEATMLRLYKNAVVVKSGLPPREEPATRSSRTLASGCDGAGGGGRSIEVSTGTALREVIVAKLPRPATRAFYRSILEPHVPAWLTVDDVIRDLAKPPAELPTVTAALGAIGEVFAHIDKLAWALWRTDADVQAHVRTRADSVIARYEESQSLQYEGRPRRETVVEERPELRKRAYAIAWERDALGLRTKWWNRAIAALQLVEGRDV